MENRDRTVETLAPTARFYVSKGSERSPMRNQFITSFWRNAHQQLPASVRERYALQMRAAERWELAIGALIETWSRARLAITRALQGPRSAH